MPQNALFLIQQIEYLNDCIDEECQEDLFYTSQTNRLIAERIKNASTLLLNNAIRFLRNQNPIIKSERPLSLVRTNDLMLEIYQIMLSTDYLAAKENRIRNVIKDKYALNPTEILLENHAFYAEKFKKLHLIHGGS